MTLPLRPSRLTRRLRPLIDLFSRQYTRITSSGSKATGLSSILSLRSPKRKSLVKIAVLGNCQRTQLSLCLSALTKDAVIEAQPSRRLADLRSYIESNDFVLFQRTGTQVLNELTPAERKKILVYPRIFFSGLQPDWLQCQRVGSPIGRGSQNSALALYAWLHSLSVEETIALFCEEVFDKLSFFDQWERSRRLLLDEGNASDVPLEEMFESWRKRGAFMYHPVHPRGYVVADIARAIVHQLGLKLLDKPNEELPDAQANGMQWPVYAEIAARLGFQGGYDFVTMASPRRPRQILPLPEFVKASFAIFDKDQPDRSNFSDFQWKTFQGLSGLNCFEGRILRPKASPKNPYSGLPPTQFWRSSIERVAASSVDPVQSAPFKFHAQTKLATAGSCFAQHISRALIDRGFNYFVMETAPQEMGPDEAAERNFGTFSARYGNIYTARQLLQLFDRAFRDFRPRLESWERPDGRFVDPFRPRIEPLGFETDEQMSLARTQHFRAIRQLFRKLDIFVFTLGLTEAWRTKGDGAVLPLAPGVVAATRNLARYEFVNFQTHEIIADLATFVKRLAYVNPRAKVILTVSPVPLIATYENRHVLVSTTYSKSALRVAAEETAAAFDNVWYFPSYEIITGSYNRGAYFESDLRSVTPEGVGHVMRLFFEHGAEDVVSADVSHPIAAPAANADMAQPAFPDAIGSGSDTVNGPATGLQDFKNKEAERDADARRGFDIVCDEEIIEKSVA